MVVDAVDEAGFDTHLLWPEAGPGVHVVLSARPVAGTDLKDLLPPSARSNVLRLGPLTSVDLQAALKATGIAADDATTRALEEVTAGDPYFVRVVLDDLGRDPSVASAVLIRLAGDAARGDEWSAFPGLECYLDRWWDELYGRHEDVALSELLSYLAVAEGPLTRSELIGIDAQDSIGGRNIDALVHKVARFVVGDARSGYAFAHERFKGHVAIKLADEMASASERIDRFCDGWRERPDTDNGYAFQYGLLHRHRRALEAGNPAAYLDALTHDFLARKADMLGRHAPSLEDLERGFARQSSSCGRQLTCPQ